MGPRPKSAAYIAAHIRRVLKDGGSAPHSEELQRFFKETVRARGWYTRELRRFAAAFRRPILEHRGLPFLIEVADKLFAGRVLEEKNMAVLLLEKSAAKFGDAEFKLFGRWIDRVTNWAEHDALAHYLIGPLVLANPRRAAVLPRWARSRNRWRRRAAAVALIHAARHKRLREWIVEVADLLLADRDEMVQKGVAWLLREWVKFDRKPAVAYVRSIRRRAPRLVLRTACETLPPRTRAAMLT